MNKLLIIGEFPAPYRVEVFADLAKHWSSKVYFEYQQDEKERLSGYQEYLWIVIFLIIHLQKKNSNRT